MVFKEFKKSIEVGGQMIDAMVSIRVEEEDMIELEGSFDFGSEEENEKYLERFASGELFSAWIQVTASALGETGTDSLGACHIHSNNYFDSKPFENDVNQTVDYHGMIENSLEELKKTIINRANALKPFANI